MDKRHLKAPPRLAREGFVPAAPEKRVNKGAMLIPKTGRPFDHLPTATDLPAAVSPPERRALLEIVETAEVVRENSHIYLVARVSSATLDGLAGFEAGREDMEEDGSDEPEETDCDLGYGETPGMEGGEPDAPELRRRFIAERQKPGREHEWNGRRFVDPPSYDRAKDDEEGRRMNVLVKELAAGKR